MLFATYSAGYRSGGFNGRVNSLEEARQPYDTETVDNYELGIKSEWWDNRLRLNASGRSVPFQRRSRRRQHRGDRRVLASHIPPALSYSPLAPRHVFVAPSLAAAVTSRELVRCHRGSSTQQVQRKRTLPQLARER